MNYHRMRREQEEEKARLRGLRNLFHTGITPLDLTPTKGGIVPMTQQSVAPARQSVSDSPSSVTHNPSHNGPTC